jgi:predicted DNA binding protein
MTEDMSMYEASFKVRHECPYRDLSEQFPEITIREWYLHDCQVLEFSAQTVAHDALLAEVDALGTILHTTADDAGLHVVARSCECSLDDSIIHRFQAHNCLYLPPTIYRQGWEHYTVIAFDDADVRALLQELDASRAIDVLSKTALEERHVPHSTLFSTDRLFADLTPRQLEALRLAVDNGYYEQPRGASIEELATQTTVARATFEEHLRKAENKLITNAGQFIRLLTETQGPNRLRPASETASTTAETD